MAQKPPKPPLSSLWTQFYPPKPAFTEKDVPDLTGKVYIVTGSNTGVGKEVARILYAKNAKVYMAARSKDKANAAITTIKAAAPSSSGDLIFLSLDLADLSSLKASAAAFTAREPKLHALFSNAGVQAVGPDADAPTPQGHEVHLGVNVLGTHLFTQLLTPTLVATAAAEPPGTVRVVSVGSMGTEFVGEENLGLDHDRLASTYAPRKPLERYGLSKAGGWLLATEYARRHRPDGLVCVPVNPGHLDSDLYRGNGAVFRFVLRMLVMYPPVNGAYVELFAAFSPNISLENSGSYVVPWGRLHPIRQDLVNATKSEAEGGNGHAARFWDWAEQQVKPFT